MFMPYFQVNANEKLYVMQRMIYPYKDACFNIVSVMGPVVTETRDSSGVTFSFIGSSFSKPVPKDKKRVPRKF